MLCTATFTIKVTFEADDIEQYATVLDQVEDHLKVTPKVDRVDIIEEHHPLSE